MSINKALKRNSFVFLFLLSLSLRTIESDRSSKEKENENQIQIDDVDFDVDDAKHGQKNCQPQQNVVSLRVCVCVLC